jgi:hypothetical protein
MNRRRGMRIWPLAILSALVVSGCGPGEAATASVHQNAYGHEAGGDTAAITSAMEAYRKRQPGELTTVAGETVIGRTGPGDQEFEVALRSPGAATHLSRQIGTRSFELGLRVRQPELRQYPCASCHQGTGFTAGTDRVADAHQNIQPSHPRETGATCVTCHSPEDVSRLALGSGERATLDHAYRLCAQCHSPQVEAWAAGAHGKRLDGWQGRRVVMGCADCHDPHHPALEQRIPFNPPRIARTGGRE